LWKSEALKSAGSIVRRVGPSRFYGVEFRFDIVHAPATCAKSATSERSQPPVFVYGAAIATEHCILRRGHPCWGVIGGTGSVSENLVTFQQNPANSPQLVSGRFSSPHWSGSSSRRKISAKCSGTPSATMSA
jgi:hypothetical protein